jgi:hypothetical protein
LYLEGRLQGTTFPPQKARHFEKQNAHSKMLAFCFSMFSCDTHRVSQKKLEKNYANSLYQLMSSKWGILEISTPWVKGVKCMYNELIIT